MAMQYFVTRIANEGKAEYQKRREEQLAEIEQKWPRARKEKTRDGIEIISVSGKKVAYLADR
jgi:hypothetical protein